MAQKHKHHYPAKKGTPQGVSTICHSQPKMIGTFPMNGAKLWIDGWEHILDAAYGTADLLIRLKDGHSHLRSDIPVPVKGNAEAELLFGPEFFAPVHAPAVIEINWPDFGIPRLTADWWWDFSDRLNGLPDGAVIGMGCDGGHGRTGTAACILAALNSWDIGKHVDYVAWLRSVYCEKVVETEKQLDYIERITGEPIVSGVSLGWASSYQSNDWSEVKTKTK